MTHSLGEELLGDLNLTHAFINTLSASYQGMYVYENVFGVLSQASDREEKMKNTANVLDKISEWWAMFQRHEPLMRYRFHQEGVEGEASKACRLLEVAQKRLDGLMQELLASSSVESILRDGVRRALRVANSCEAAYARQHFVQGLIAYGEILDREEVADRWRQHLLYCRRETAEANALFERFQRMEGEIDEAAAAGLLDLTLTDPVAVGRRAVDVRSVFGLLRNRFDYADAGIPEAEAVPWKRGGFAPADAAGWRLAGMGPEESQAWIDAGIPDPLGAATYAWRGIEQAVASKWYEQGYNGRVAAGWIRQGISEPDRIPREA